MLCEEGGVPTDPRVWNLGQRGVHVRVLCVYCLSVCLSVCLSPPSHVRQPATFAIDAWLSHRCGVGGPTIDRWLPRWSTIGQRVTDVHAMQVSMCVYLDGWNDCVMHSTVFCRPSTHTRHAHTENVTCTDHTLVTGHIPSEPHSHTHVGRQVSWLFTHLAFFFSLT